MKLFQQFLAAWSLVACVQGSARSSQQRCKEVTFTVSGTALNYNLTGIQSVFNNVTLLNSTLRAHNFPQIPVSGTQNLAGWYCLPTVGNANSNKLQVLFGSITTNREFWTALGGTALNNPPSTPYQPGNYSWVQYANNQGYPTLALDLLGQGLSSHPDPILVTQAFYEITLYHDLATQLKAGTTGQISATYKTLYYIGNSYGSELGNFIAEQYPSDFAAFVLTGWSAAVLIDLPGIAMLTPQPAAIVDPAKFGTLNPGYVTTPNEQTRTNSFFGVEGIISFDPFVAELFFQRKDVVSLGQLVSVYAITQPAPAYRGRVLVLDGEEDQAFCGLGSSALSPNAMCGPLPAQAAALFANAEQNYATTPKAGHALIYCNSAPQVFQIAHQFLAGARFAS